MIQEPWLAEFPELRIDSDFNNPYFVVLRVASDSEHAEAGESGVRETSASH